MQTDQELRDKLRKIEALFSGAATPGEKTAAGAAAERIRARLSEAKRQGPSVETKFSLPDPWSRQLFCALARRYGLRPYRYPRMHRQSILLRAPESFIQNVFWPEFQALDAALVSYLQDITQRLIREEVHRETGDAEEVHEAGQIEG